MLAPERLPERLKIGGFRDAELEAARARGGQEIHWPHCIALVVWTLSSGWLLVCAVRGRRRRLSAARQPTGGAPEAIAPANLSGTRP